MNAPNRTTTTKSSNSTGNAGQVLREMSETSSTQTKQALEQVTAATADATTLMKDTYAVAVKHAQEYNGKFIEFARANTEAAFEFVHQVAGVKSPSEFFELSASHSRRQLETLTEQAKELAALAQKAVLATTERVHSEANKVSSQRS